MNTERQGETLFLREAVTVSTVTAAQYRFFCDSVADQAVDTLDLSAVSRADSACVALLLAAVRIKKQQQQPLRFVHMPVDLRMLTSLYEVDPWIQTA